MTPSSRVSHDSEYVCKLKRALYGLKQAPRTWFEKFSVVISSFRFVSCSNDSAFFIKCTDASRIILSSYIDDIDDISFLKTKLAR